MIVKKIPTLFVRDENDRRYVTEQVTPGCEWVLAEEGRATRKYDGTCVMLSVSGDWWARREVKPGKEIPPRFVPVNHDEVTGKLMGWEPIGQSAFAKFHAEALTITINLNMGVMDPGTYELIGPKINGNPERAGTHLLIKHSGTPTVAVPELTFQGIRWTVLDESIHSNMEGIVWHHPDGRMAKIKARDFRPDAYGETSCCPTS